VAVQGLQRLLHELALRPALEGRVDLAATSGPPLPLRLVQRWALCSGSRRTWSPGACHLSAPKFACRAPQPVGT